MRVLTGRIERADVHVYEHDDGQREVIVRGDSGATTVLPAGPYTDQVIRNAQAASGSGR